MDALLIAASGKSLQGLPRNCFERKKQAVFPFDECVAQSRLWASFAVFPHQERVAHRRPDEVERHPPKERAQEARRYGHPPEKEIRVVHVEGLRARLGGPVGETTDHTTVCNVTCGPKG